PKFKELRKTNTRAGNPLREALTSKRHRRAVMFAITIPMLNGAGYYILFTYMPTFLNRTHEFTVAQGLLITSISLAAVIVTIPLAGRISDRVGRRPTMIGSSVLVATLALPCYSLMANGSVTLAAIGAALL